MVTMGRVFQFFFSTAPDHLLGTAVNLSIMVIGAVSAAELWRALRRTRNAHRELRDLSSRIDGAETDSAIVESGRRISKTHLAARRIETLSRLKAVGAEIDASSLAAIAVGELDREGRFARWASSTVVLFGLAGTLIGLTQAVITAQPMLGEIVDGPAAVQAVMGTFSGLGTAFSTTLMGILWAVFIGIGLGLLRSRQGVFLQQLEELSLVAMYPRFRTSPALAMVDAARTLTALEQKLSSAFSEIVMQVRTQGLALTKSIEDSVGSLVASSSRTGRELRDSVQGSVGALVKDVQKHGVSLTSTVDRSLSTLVEEQRGGVEQMLARLDRTLAATAAMIGDAGSDTRSLAENVRTLQAGVEAMRHASESLLRMTPGIEEAIARQVDQQTRDMHETLHTYVGKLTQSVDRQDAIIEEGLLRVGEGFPRFGELLMSRIREQGTILSEALEPSQRDLVAATQLQAQQSEQLAAAVTRLVETTSFFDQRAAQDHDASQRLQMAVKELTTEVTKIESALARTGDRLAVIVPPSEFPTRTETRGDGAWAPRTSPSAQRGPIISPSPSTEPRLESEPMPAMAPANSPEIVTTPHPTVSRAESSRSWWDRVFGRG